MGLLYGKIKQFFANIIDNTGSQKNNRILLAALMKSLRLPKPSSSSKISQKCNTG